MELSHLLKKRLFSPGPTTIPLQSQFAAVDNNPYHRSDAFNSIIMNCLDSLKAFFGTQNIPLILSSSGTGAMEAALVNLTEPGSKVLMIAGGKFGERWAKMSQAYACDSVVVEVPWGEVLSPESLTAHLSKHPKVKAVFFQGVETSTGAYFPVKEFTKIIRDKTDALVVVDALSSILCHEMKMDDWGVDCAIAASQKGFGVPPGLSFVALSERARSRISKRPRFYFNLEEEIRHQVTGKTAWTPATQLILTLQASLEKLTKLGRENLYEYHRLITEAVRQSLLAMGMELFVKQNYAYSLSTFVPPKNIDGDKLKSLIQKKYLMTMVGGQDHLKGKIIRLAHYGFADPFDVLAAMGVLELAMRDMGSSAALGKGTSTFMKHFPM